MAKKLRCGVIGVGMGKGHIKGYQSHPDAEVVAVADTDPVRLQAAADELQVPQRYTDARRMLRRENLDIVSIATPNKFHLPLARLVVRFIRLRHASEAYETATSPPRRGLQVARNL